MSTVHPRMRGERVFWLVALSMAAGSSPHARGTRQYQETQAAAVRFIPACAGNAR